jgi:hypothetical protein
MNGPTWGDVIGAVCLILLPIILWCIGAALAL